MDDIEIDQEADGESTESQVRQRLRPMNGVQFVDSLQLYEYEIFDHIVRPKGAVDSNVVVSDGDPFLVLELQADSFELSGKARVVNLFEATRTNRGMDGHRCTDDLIGELVDRHRSLGVLCILGVLNPKQPASHA